MDEKELDFIKKMLELSLNVEVAMIKLPKDMPRLKRILAETEIFEFAQSDMMIQQYLNQCQYQGHHTIITGLDTYYLLTCLSEDKSCHLVVGPFLCQTVSEEMLLQACRNLNVPGSLLPTLSSYLLTIPLIDLNQITSIMFLVIKRLCCIDKVTQVVMLEFRDHEYRMEEPPQELSVAILEKRYEIEELFMKTVSEGNITLSYSYYSQLKRQVNGLKRNKDPMRNLKNNLIILNVLLRKASQMGGVQPYYLDSLSTKWAISIENEFSKEKLDSYYQAMIRAYCLQVKNYSLKEFHPLVKRALNYILMYQSAKMSVTEIAAQLSITPDYLSKLFKNELHCSVIEYINQRRISAALQLLNTTDMPIQTIASYVGLPDISYFGRLFRRQVGLSAREYRAQMLSSAKKK